MPTEARYRSGPDQSRRTARGALQPNPSFDPLLACYDLTQDRARFRPPTAAPVQPAACIPSRPRQHPGAGPVHPGHHHPEELDVQPGIRGDYYDGITSANQAEPRLGIAYNIKPTGTVLRVSYARTLETPFNENLVLASLGCNDPVINDLHGDHPGLSVPDNAPLSPGWRNEFHAGLSAGFRTVSW